MTHEKRIHNKYPCSIYVFQDNQDPTALENTESLGKFCGSSASVFPPQIATTKRFAVVRFASDASVAHNGFRNVVVVSIRGRRRFDYNFALAPVCVLVASASRQI